MIRFVVIVHWDCPDTAKEDKVVAAVFKAAEAAGCEEVSVNEGGPCWGPYVEATCDTMEQAQKTENSILTRLGRFKGVRIVE